MIDFNVSRFSRLFRYLQDENKFEKLSIVIESLGNLGDIRSNACRYVDLTK